MSQEETPVEKNIFSRLLFLEIKSEMTLITHNEGLTDQSNFLWKLMKDRPNGKKIMLAKLMSFKKTSKDVVQMVTKFNTDRSSY